MKVRFFLFNLKNIEPDINCLYDFSIFACNWCLFFLFNKSGVSGTSGILQKSYWKHFITVSFSWIKGLKVLTKFEDI